MSSQPTSKFEFFCRRVSNHLSARGDIDGALRAIDSDPFERKKLFKEILESNDKLDELVSKAYNSAPKFSRNPVKRFLTNVSEEILYLMNKVPNLSLQGIRTSRVALGTAFASGVLLIADPYMMMQNAGSSTLPNSMPSFTNLPKYEQEKAYKKELWNFVNTFAPYIKKEYNSYTKKTMEEKDARDIAKGTYQYSENLEMALYILKMYREESHFATNIYGDHGQAIGIGQIHGKAIKDAVKYAQEHNIKLPKFTLENLINNPEAQIALSTIYFRFLLDYCNGDYKKASDMYNGGFITPQPNYTSRVLRRGTAIDSLAIALN